MHVHDFDYHLPPELIAQQPADRREHSRLMVLDRAEHTIAHERFENILRFLRAGDVLVANKSKVIPARLSARRPTGGMVELLLLRPLANNHWRVLARPSRKLAVLSDLQIEGTDVAVTLRERLEQGEWVAEFTAPGDVREQLLHAGTIPLPPYIRGNNVDLSRYQTVYAAEEGSVAAPTAGLHFSQELLTRIGEAGVETAFVTLHVGVGTFRPVSVDMVKDHVMHAEWGEVTAETADRVNRAHQEGRRVIAVGTTTTRLLESAYASGKVTPWSGDTDRFIYPGYRFRAIDGLITNFHLPKSTLIMLVSAFAGQDFVLEAYREAVQQRYRFFSFGDAMLIL